MAILVEIFFYASLLAQVGVALRVRANSQFRPLLNFLLFELGRGALFAVLNMMGYTNSSRLYAEAYMVTQPLSWVFLAWLVWDAFRQCCDRYPGMGAWRARFLVGVSVLASIVALVVAAPQVTMRWLLLPMLQCFAIASEGMYIAGAVLLVLVRAYFRIIVARDRRPSLLRGHWNTLTAYLATKALCMGTLVLFSVTAAQCQQINAVMLSVATCCYAIWWVVVADAGKATVPGGIERRSLADNLAAWSRRRA